jgi:hypothetical protein
MDNRHQQLAKILRITAETLDLSPTQYKEATDRYRAAGEWLSAEGSKLRQYRPNVYPQGSFALGTPVKPLGRDEFDIDLVVELSVPDGTQPMELKRMVGVRLAENETYRAILEEMNRCWRLNYSNLHLDSIPARPKGIAGSTAILIPDKELRCYKDSDPKGYTAWFKIRCVVQASITETKAQANVEPTPDQQGWQEKAPLQIAIQLLKRHRDVYFQTREHPPISIIVTTLAAKAYSQEDNVLVAMRGTVDRMPTGIERVTGKPHVFNPVNRGENFADKWHTEPQKEKAFFQWHAQLKNDLATLEAAASLPEISKVLERFVGKARADIVFKKYADETTGMRNTGLRADLATGILSSMGSTLGRSASVPGNTFYGAEQDTKAN